MDPKACAPRVGALGHQIDALRGRQEEIAAQLERLEHRRLAVECAKLDPAAERAMAEEGLGLDAAGWPDY